MRIILYPLVGQKVKEEKYSITDWKEENGMIHAIQNMNNDKHHLFFDISNYEKIRIKD